MLAVSSLWYGERKTCSILQALSRSESSHVDVHLRIAQSRDVAAVCEVPAVAERGGWVIKAGKREDGE